MTSEPSPDTNVPRRTWLATGLAAAAGIGWGAVAYLLFSSGSSFLKSPGVLSVAFLVMGPFVIGFVAVVVAGQMAGRRLWWSILFPWPPALLCLLFAGILAKEYWFCIALAAPLFLAVASLGGLTAWALLPTIARRREQRLGVIAFLVVFPYIFAPYEADRPVVSEVRQVHASIMINASPERVWQAVANLTEVDPAERPVSLFNVLGLPRPVQSHMDCAEIGCARRGTWEDGLAFDGTIRRIVPNREYWVDLRADTSAVHSPRAPLREVGGAMFSMVDDGYVLAPTADGGTILTLYSTYRLSTRLNAYAALWLNFLLRDIEGHLLTIEKRRAERQP